MKRKYLLAGALLISLTFIAAINSYAQEVPVNKVLIIGIDGCRPDALLTANTPIMDALWKNGAYTFNAQTDEISSSGPAWSAMLTGVWHQKHNVLNNDYEDPDLEHYPHFFHRIRQEKPELKTYSVANWGPIHKILQEGDATFTSSKISDALVAEEVASILENKEVDVMFVQLDEVDGAGHRHDYTVESKKYLNAIERSDGQVGTMVLALEQRSAIKDENWLIILSADHGGSDFGHGKNIPEHTTVFYIASGKSAIKGEIQQDVGVVDVAVTALFHLGIQAKVEWNLDGQVAGL
ncbi:MAG: alkaline phosphatase family protein [Bacteroidota bacterium]|nr:alkaline phosphatase family protein [Bacteroidota bacterium]